MTTMNHGMADSATMTRQISLVAPADEPQVALLAKGEGVLSVEPSANRKTLRITYDVRRTGMAALERLAVTAGLTPSNSLFARMARAWGAFQDENLRQSARIVHKCCSAPPTP